MYALAWLYLLRCIALSAATVAAAQQHFWTEGELCSQMLNSEYVERGSVGGGSAAAGGGDGVSDDVTDTKITCVQFNNSQSDEGDINVLNNVRILCREFDSLTYVWDNNSIDDIVIIVEFMSYQTTDVHFINMTNLSYISFYDLTPNTEYVARFRTLINGTSDHTTDTPVQTTLAIDREPDPVKTIQISNFDTAKNPDLETLLTWEPSIDMNCNYKVIYQSDHLNAERLYVEVTGAYAITLTGLQADTTYWLSVQSYYDRGTTVMESKKTKLEFVTPTCLEVHNNDVDSCPPEQPYNVTVTETRSRGGDGWDARVSWTPRNGGRGADYYAVKLDRLVTNATNGGGGGVYAVMFYNVSLPDTYQASVQAFSAAGHSAEKVVSPTRPRYVVEYPPPRHGATDRPWTAVAAAVAFAFCVAAAAAVTAAVAACRRPADAVRRRRKNAAAAADRDDYHYCGDEAAAALRKGLGLDDVDVLLDRDDVTVSDVQLGRGNFGVVRKGAVRTDRGERPVAVKTLRDHACGRDLEQFVGEILLMQKVGRHPNIVAMVGCCVDATSGRCMLVVEYCPLGDLQTYLRRVSLKSWYANDFYVDRTESTGVTAAANHKDTGNPQQTTTVTVTPPMVFNNCYLYHSEENVFLTIDDLMHFASQAANGMAFLEKNRIVHRDLAARNLLLSDHHTVKICDFGLSRDVYEQNLYQKSNRGDPLPVKWMALESLKYRIYTSQSDVWSFGVLLWEIMMLGGSPYPTISSSRIYEVLSRGYRMPRPTLCCYTLYEVMLACWHSNPANRPKFDKIKETIDSIIENQYS